MTQIILSLDGIKSKILASFSLQNLRVNITSILGTVSLCEIQGGQSQVQSTRDSEVVQEI